MIRLLWVDDNLDQDLSEKRISLLMEDDIESDFAGDATEAYHYLIDKNRKYDVVIFDLRFPPGPDMMWSRFRKNGERKYGLVLLKMIKENESGKFDHLAQTHYGVFSIETYNENSALAEPPININESNFLMKTTVIDENNFINFIRNIHKS